MLKSYLTVLLVTLLVRAVGAQTTSAGPPSVDRDDSNALGPGVTLVLTGGGAQGFAHIGVLDILDSAHIPINLIVGTSIGAAIGGLYAAGYSPAQLETFAESTDWLDVLGLNGDTHREDKILSQKDNNPGVLSLRFTGFFHPVIPQALSTGQRLTQLLNSMIIKAPAGVAEDFLKDLRVPFIAIATDIVKGKRRLLTHGDLTEALRASVTLPLRFDPLTSDTAILMDGGLLANIPTDVAKQFGARYILVSNTTSPLRPRSELTTPWDVADQIISLMMERQYPAALHRANLVITPSFDSEVVSYTEIAHSIEAGRIAARRALPELRNQLRMRPDVTQAKLPVSASAATSRIERLRVVANAIAMPDSVVTRLQANTQGTERKVNAVSTLESSVLAWYRSHGYSLAHFDSVHTDPISNTVTCFVNEGRIAKVEIQGNGFIHPNIISRELPFAVHDIFRAADADRALQNLNATGLFDYVTIRVGFDSISTNPHAPVVDVTVQPRASNVIRLGLLADNEFGAQFSAEIANENLVGTGATASLKGGLGPASRYAKATIDIPRLMSSHATFLAQIYSGFQDIHNYQTTTDLPQGRIVSTEGTTTRELRNLGLRVRIGSQLGNLGASFLELRHESQEWYDIGDSTHQLSNLQLTTLAWTNTIDTRDDRDYPHTGSYLDTKLETAIPHLGGEASYTKLSGTLMQAIPLSGLHTISLRLTAGFGDLLPRLEQFTLGGMQSFYGLQPFEFRGEQIATGSLTYQIAIPHVLLFPTFVSMRYDLGAVWPKPEAIKFESLLHGIGAQVGMRTPIGLAQFALGEAFRFTTDPNHPVAFGDPDFYFSIGANL